MSAGWDLVMKLGCEKGIGYILRMGCRKLKCGMYKGLTRGLIYRYEY